MRKTILPLIYWVLAICLLLTLRGNSLAAEQRDCAWVYYAVQQAVTNTVAGIPKVIDSATRFVESQHLKPGDVIPGKGIFVARFACGDGRGTADTLATKGKIDTPLVQQCQYHMHEPDHPVCFAIGCSFPNQCVLYQDPQCVNGWCCACLPY